MAKKGFLDGYKTYDTSNGFGNPKQWRASFRERMSKEEAAEVVTASRETPHSILGIVPGATQQEIKKAYRKQIAEWHPDYNPHRLQEAEEMSRKIIAAYTVLKA